LGECLAREWRFFNSRRAHHCGTGNLLRWRAVLFARAGGYVGTYCSDKFLGVCLTKKKVYCCFESKLSRVLQEQGRLQLPKPWDKPKEEQCEGFTLDEFARLDLSQMDFSEVYAEFTEAARLGTTHRSIEHHAADRVRRDLVPGVLQLGIDMRLALSGRASSKESTGSWVFS